MPRKARLGVPWTHHELGGTMAEIARQVGVGTNGVAMVIKRMEKKQKLNGMNKFPKNCPSNQILVKTV